MPSSAAIAHACTAPLPPYAMSDEAAVVGAVAGEHPARGVRHVGVDDPLDAPRRLGDVEAERLGDLALDRGA